MHDVPAECLLPARVQLAAYCMYMEASQLQRLLRLFCANAFCGLTHVDAPAQFQRWRFLARSYG